MDKFISFCWDIVLILLLVLCVTITGPDVLAAEDLAQAQAEKVLDMIGPHGIFAIIGSIFMVRLIRVLWYLDKRQSFQVTLITSAFMGAASAYFSAEAVTVKYVAGGSFMALVGTPIVFAILTWGIGFAYAHLKWEILVRLYFFLSPRPMKVKKGGIVQVVDPDEGLTQFFDNARLDKRPDPADETELTRTLTDEEREQITGEDPTNRR